MKWGRNYTRRAYFRSSLWIVPVASYAASVVIVRALAALDDWLKWQWDWKIEVATAQLVLQGTVAATLSFLVFTFSSLLVAIQVASAQLTPRIIATTLLRDNTIRAIVALFVLTFAVSLGTLARAQTHVPYILLTFAILLSGISTIAFIYLIDYAARLLRPVSIVWTVGEEGLRAIEQVYVRKIGHPYKPSPPPPALGPPRRVVLHRGTSAIVLAADIGRLLAEAERVGGVVESAFQVGDFIAVGEPLFLLYAGAELADDRKLVGAVAFGRERTIEQDPTFAFRIVTDIALKALSAAINDPTTAVLAIDQLHRLLRAVGRRHLHDDVVHDRKGTPRLIFRTPNWDDFVQLSCREVRLCGANNLQVARRLRAMLENLIQVLPESRHVALREEIKLLDLTLDRLDMLPEDLLLARTPDVKGIGSGAVR